MGFVELFSGMSFTQSIEIIEPRREVSRPDVVHHRRLDHLDALRGLAAMAVLVSHYVSAFGLPFAPKLFSTTPMRFWWDGTAAVSFFFVLSGLVLSIRHFRTTPRPDLSHFSFTGFAVARFCRIWLPYLVMLLISVALWRFSAQHMTTNPPMREWMNKEWTRPPTLGRVLAEAASIKTATAVDGRHEFVPQAWTLTVEIVMSMLVPIGILAASRSTIWLLLGAVVASVFARMAPFVLHFAIGIAIAKHYQPIMVWLEPRFLFRCLIGMIGFLFYQYEWIFPTRPALHPYTIYYFMPAIGAGLILLTISATPRARAALSRGIIHHIGRISFSIYLVHLALLLVVTPRFLHLLLLWPEKLAWSTGLIFTCVLTILVSDPMYRFIEVPTNALGKRLANWIADRQ